MTCIRRAGISSQSLGSNIRQALKKGKLDIEIFHSQLLTMKMPNGSVRVRILKKLAEIQLSTGTATANEKSAAIPLTHVVAVRNKKGAAENDRSTLMTERIFE